jgi:pilus assembly protein Flp/PilA
MRYAHQTRCVDAFLLAKNIDILRSKEDSNMRPLIGKLLERLQCLIKREDGQDLVEYALVVAMIAFGATAGMKTLAGGINTAFVHINTTLGNYTV